jgi:hypothetical protein
MQYRLFRRAAFQAAAQAQVAGRRKLDGVAEQVDEDLLDAQGSPTKLRVTSGARSMHSSRPFSSTWPMSRSLMSSSSMGSSKFNCSMLSLPASMREKSRMSLMMPSRWSAARRILLMCCCWTGLSAVSRQGRTTRGWH